MDKLLTFWVVESNLQVSGELTTSQGPNTSFEFVVSLVGQLFGEVIIPVANGSEEIKVVTIIDVLRRAKANVNVVLVEKSLHIAASCGSKIIEDEMISVATESVYDLIILHGGKAGAERLSKSTVLKKLLKEQESARRILGTMGFSLAMLKRQGLVKGKQVTAHPSVVGMLDSAVNYAQVVINSNVITSKGLGTALSFAFVVVSKLFEQARARSVVEGLVLEYQR